MFGLSGVYHTMLFADVFAPAEGAAAPEPNMVVIGLAFVILGLMMAHMYPKGYKGGPAMSEGARFGCTIGLLWVVPLSMIMVAVGELTWTILAYDVPYHALEGAIGGIIIAKMHGGSA